MEGRWGVTAKVEERRWRERVKVRERRGPNTGSEEYASLWKLTKIPSSTTPTNTTPPPPAAGKFLARSADGENPKSKTNGTNRHSICPYYALVDSGFILVIIITIILFLSSNANVSSSLPPPP